jgi:hypothetical protein
MNEIDTERMQQLQLEWVAEEGMLSPAELHEFCGLLLSALENEKENNKNQISLTRSQRERAEMAEERVKELEAQLQAADEGMLKSSDPIYNPWQGIHKECKGWQIRAEQAENRLKKAEAELSRINLGKEEGL